MKYSQALLSTECMTNMPQAAGIFNIPTCLLLADIISTSKQYEQEQQWTSFALQIITHHR